MSTGDVEKPQNSGAHNIALQNLPPRSEKFKKLERLGQPDGPVSNATQTSLPNLL